jgi:hypothetical protein
MEIIRELEAKDSVAGSSPIRHTMKWSNSSDYFLERLRPPQDYFRPEKVLQISQQRHCLVGEVNKEDIFRAAREEREESKYYGDPR